MKSKLALIISLLLAVAAIAAAFAYVREVHPALLYPAGLIAQKQRDIMLLVIALSMIIIVPVFLLTIYTAWTYREGNMNAKHNPNWDYKPIVDVVWWTVPGVLIIVVSVIIWTSTHALDPYKQIVSTSGAPVLHIQVVAMDWKWLFIYPDLGISTVNYFEFPVNTPVDFEITSDAPMNSFWIPELGGQIYAMPSMSTELNLIASTTGSYPGMSANISGVDFSSMNFTAQSVSQDDFNSWVAGAQAGGQDGILSADEYNALAQPGTTTEATYSLGDSDLYNKILMKDMMEAPAVATSSDDTMDMSGMNMQGMDMRGMDMKQ